MSKTFKQSFLSDAKKSMIFRCLVNYFRERVEREWEEARRKNGKTLIVCSKRNTTYPNIWNVDGGVHARTHKHCTCIDEKTLVYYRAYVYIIIFCTHNSGPKHWHCKLNIKHELIIYGPNFNNRMYIYDTLYNVCTMYVCMYVFIWYLAKRIINIVCLQNNNSTTIYHLYNVLVRIFFTSIIYIYIVQTSRTCR